MSADSLNLLSLFFTHVPFTNYLLKIVSVLSGLHLWWPPCFCASRDHNLNADVGAAPLWKAGYLVEVPIPHEKKPSVTKRLILFLHGMPSLNMLGRDLFFSRRSSNLKQQYMIKFYVFRDLISVMKNMLNHIIYSSLDRIYGSNFQVQLWCGSAAIIREFECHFHVYWRFWMLPMLPISSQGYVRNWGWKRCIHSLTCIPDFVEVVFLH